MKREVWESYGEDSKRSRLNRKKTEKTETKGDMKLGLGRRKN